MVKSKSSSNQTQSDIRTACKKLRTRITPEERQKASEEIARKVLVSDLFSNASDIAIYIPMQSEVDTWPIIRRAWQLKKRIFAPIVQENSILRFHQFEDEDQLFTNEMGLEEPIDGQFVQADALDLVLAPLVAFDSQKNRIGMGGGYYDRTFSFLEQKQGVVKPVLAGLAFEHQRVEKIAPNPWDIRLFRVFTESSES
jgi:5-formyltetrahydrofolate cyclo-ligase